MGSKQESLNKRIRETISSLSDEDLASMRRASAGNYTPFAHQVLEEELARRKRIKVSVDEPTLVTEVDPAHLPGKAAADKRSGCYIEVWSDKNFEGEHLRIEGPSEYQALAFAGLEWGDSISSLRVGPSAFVLVYADRGFKGAMMSFGPGQEAPDLDELDFDDEIDSIRLVNSIKVFDGFRSEDAPTPTSEPERKPNKGRGRRKIRAA